MKIAIHKKYSGALWKCWSEYCDSRDIAYDFVDCYAHDAIETLRGYDILLWNFHQAVPADLLEARSILLAAEMMGVKVFPDWRTAFSFDDKVAETYLLQAIGAPVVPSWVFYDREEAIEWARSRTEYPIVAKLRGGAGSANVLLLKSASQAIGYIKKMFGSGLSAAPKYFPDLKNHYIRGGNWSGRMARIKKIPGYFKKVARARHLPRESGYVYFQEFIPGAGRDVRITMVGSTQAWTYYRTVRENDFRASASGVIDYDPADVPMDILMAACDAAAKLDVQSVGFDFVEDASGKGHIVEMSYGCGLSIKKPTGYWKIENGQPVHQDSKKMVAWAILDNLMASVEA